MSVSLAVAVLMLPSGFVSSGRGSWEVTSAAGPPGPPISRVSVSSTGVQANSDSWSPAVSDDGRLVVFSSLASNLVPGDTNNVEDVFVRTGACSAVQDVDLDVTYISRTPLYHAGFSKSVASRQLYRVRAQDPACWFVEERPAMCNNRYQEGTIKHSPRVA
jgi:hypothetical protein